MNECKTNGCRSCRYRVQESKSFMGGAFVFCCIIAFLLYQTSEKLPVKIVYTIPALALGIFTAIKTFGKNDCTNEEKHKSEPFKLQYNCTTLECEHCQYNYKEKRIILIIILALLVAAMIPVGIAEAFVFKGKGGFKASFKNKSVIATNLAFFSLLAGIIWISVEISKKPDCAN